MSGLVESSADARSKTIGGNFRVRAWVNFNGISGQVAKRAYGNVSSIARNSRGTYDVNLIQKPPNDDYCALVNGNVNNSNNDVRRNERVIEYTVDSCKVLTGYNGNSNSHEDFEFVNVIFIW